MDSLHSAGSALPSNFRIIQEGQLSSFGIFVAESSSPNPFISLSRHFACFAGSPLPSASLRLRGSKSIAFSREFLQHFHAAFNRAVAGRVRQSEVRVVLAEDFSRDHQELFGDRFLDEG